jgi:hypothetical protein
MAYQFGLASTDVVTVADTTSPAAVSYHFWIYTLGLGGANAGRVFDKRSGADAQAEVIYIQTGNILRYERNRSTTSGIWRTDGIVVLSTWQAFGFRIDNTLTTNDGEWFSGGLPVTTVEFSTPNGTLITNTSPYSIGNRSSDVARNWNGYIAHIAKWSRLVTDAEFALMGRTPLALAPSSYPDSAVWYLPFIDGTSDFYGKVTTVSGGALVSNNPSVLSGSQLGGYAIGLDR